MIRKLAVSTVLALGGACCLSVPASAIAGNVGYFKADGVCTGGDPSAAISAAGHTPVALANVSAESLASLDGLVYDHICSTENFAGIPDVNNAVANGMALFLNLHLKSNETDAATQLPGSPAITVTYNCGPDTRDTNLAPGSPIASGTAGTLTDASLDSAGFCSSSGYVSSGPLPGGFTPLLTSVGNVSGFSYLHGNGRVVVGLTTLAIGLPGGTSPNYVAGASTFYSNVVEWMLEGTPTEPAPTCASEGYTGTKLQWCKNICEMGYTGATLNMWIRRWTDRYRTLPYCALEPAPV